MVYVSGIDVAHDLSQKGFNEIYLASGRTLKEPPEWIKGQVGKRPPI